MNVLAERDVDQGIGLLASVGFFDGLGNGFVVADGSKIRPSAGNIPGSEKEHSSFPGSLSDSRFIIGARGLRQIFDRAQLDQRKAQFQALLHQARLKELWILFFSEEFSGQ